ncbi:MAG TPA: chaperone NapD [Cellvibrio sp.]|nr:chaperone NapD [Cellvibrio sp.]
MNQQFIPTRDISSPPQQLHIASLIAHAQPEQIPALRAWLLAPRAQLNNHIHIEIHAESAQGKLVLVTESEAEKAIVDFLDELRGRPGVLNAALVYHEYLSAQDLADEHQHQIAREEQPL